MLRDTSGCHLLLCTSPRAVSKLSRDGDVHPSLQAGSAPAAAPPQPCPDHVTPSWAPAATLTQPHVPNNPPAREMMYGKTASNPRGVGREIHQELGVTGLWMRRGAENINIGADNNGDGDAWEGEDGSPAISGHYCSSCNASPGKNGMDTSRQCIYLKSPNFY